MEIIIAIVYKCTKPLSMNWHKALYMENGTPKTYLSLRKCKLNATNAIDNIIPIRASVDTVKNAIGEMVATRNLKIRFAIGT